MRARVAALLCRVLGHRWHAPDAAFNFRTCQRCGECGWVVPA